jgi:hypothetical protein
VAPCIRVEYLEVARIRELESNYTIPMQLQASYFARCGTWRRAAPDGIPANGVPPPFIGSVDLLYASSSSAVSASRLGFDFARPQPARQQAGHEPRNERQQDEPARTDGTRTVHSARP